MKVLVIGGGGREHAVCKKLSESKDVTEILCAPGNAGIAQVARCIPEVKATDIEGIVALAQREKVDFVCVTPDDPLALGCVDKLEAAGIPAFGPTAYAAQMEASKIFSKNLMRKYGIPTAKSETFTEMDKALAYLDTQGAPIVVKADGLALGKGVVVAATVEEAKQAVVEMMQGGKFGQSGARVLIEECMVGREVTVLCFCDGKTIVPMKASQDHKRALDGDKGPNTGGMGAYSPVPQIGQDVIDTAIETIVKPTVQAMADEGTPFTGILYAGLIATADGPKVIEFNARFGDPETEVVLPKLTSDLGAGINAILNDETPEFTWDEDNATLGVVLASDGYPTNVVKGAAIPEIKVDDDSHVYYAGVTRGEHGLVANSGRVLFVETSAADIKTAQDKVYGIIDKLDTTGMFYRHDIGFKALNA